MNSYFGGLGSGKGWNKFPFFITYEELEKIFLKIKFYLVVTNSRVDLGYKETLKREYLELYKEYEKRIQKSEIIDYNLLNPLYISLTKNLGISYEKIFDDIYKILKFKEPIVNLSPLSIFYKKQNNSDLLNVDVDGDKNKTLYFGLIMEFPKVVSFSNEGHSLQHKTEDFSNYKLYSDLINEIMSITKTCIIESPYKKRKTRIRISDSCKDILNNNKFFIYNNLKIK